MFLPDGARTPRPARAGRCRLPLRRGVRRGRGSASVWGGRPRPDALFLHPGGHLRAWRLSDPPRPGEPGPTRLPAAVRYLHDLTAGWGKSAVIVSAVLVLSI